MCGFALCATAMLTGGRAFAQNSNTNADARAARQGKRVTPLRGSDTSDGSRVTVTADAPLNDYAAYKSGDRFYVVVPGAANSGGGASGVRGRGYSDVQTQRRGNDLVYSFKLQPGAKARVSQRFNRLDVVFDGPGGGAANAAATNVSTSQVPTPTPTRNTTTDLDTASSGNTSDARTTNAERLPTSADRALAASAAAARRRAEIANALDPIPPNPAFEQTTPTASATPFVTDIPPPDQIAQAQPPPVFVPAQPGANTPTTNAPAQTTPTFGTVVARSWGWGLLLLALIFGVGLFFATRGGTSERVVAATPPSAAKSDTVEEDFEEREYSEPKVISSGARGGATIASATMLDSTTQPLTSDFVAADHATGAAVVAPAIIAAGAAAGARDDGSQDKRDNKEHGQKQRHIVAPVTDAELDDAEIVGAEVRKLLAGDEYNEKIIQSAGDHARTLVGAELVAALTGRDDLRRTTAREAFISFGYFDRATHDLQHARASAERASAARALGFVDSKLATPALIHALMDKSPEVRRASVEALAQVRDPAAVPALEARRKHEKRRDMPRQLITRAIAACAAGTTPAKVADAAAPAVVAAPAVAAAHVITAPVEAADVATTETETTVVETNEVEPAESVQAVNEALVAVEDDATTAAAEVEEVQTLAPTESVVVTEDLASIESEPTTQGFDIPPVNEAMLVEPQPVELVATPIVEVEHVVEREVESARDESEAVEFQGIETQDTAGETVTLEAAPPVIETIPVAETVDAAIVETVEVAPEAEVTLETLAPEAYDTEVVHEETATHEEYVTHAGFEVLLETTASHDPNETLVTALPSVPLHEEVTIEHTGFDIAPAAEVELHALDAERFADTEVPATTLFDVDVTHPSGVAESPAGFGLESAAIDTEPHATDGEWFDLDMNASASPLSFENQIALAPPEPIVASLEQPVAIADAVAPAEHELGLMPFATQDSQTPETFVPNEDYGADYAGIAYVPAVDIDEEPVAETVVPVDETFILSGESFSTLPDAVQTRLLIHDAATRARGVADLARVRSDESVQAIYSAFDDTSLDVQVAAALALHATEENRANAFTHALREATPERRRNIGQGIAASGLADEAINNLAGESREKTYEAFSLLFLMAKTGEFGSLIKAIEQNPNTEVRLAVVKLLALSGQPEILPAFRRLAVRGSLPVEVRSAVMEAIYQIANQGTSSAE